MRPHTILGESIQVKVIGVNAPRYVFMRFCNTDIVLDHEVDKTITVNQYDLVVDIIDVLAGSVFEAARCNENTFLSFFSR